MTVSRKPVALALVAVALAACSGAGVSARRSVSPAPTPTPTPTPTPAIFDARRTYQTVAAIAAFGAREASSASYRKAADYVASAFSALGYTVSRQSVPIPAGRSVGTPVPAGRTQNVIARPPGFDPSRPHLLVGAHLDSVPVSPGANDNATGVAVVLELARLARLQAPALPIEWVAWGAEERRNPGSKGGMLGSAWFVSHMTPAERSALRGMLAIDMVGDGDTVIVAKSGETPRAFIEALLATGRRLAIPTAETTLVGLYSDHTPFELAGFTVALLWAGKDAEMHTARDTIAIVQVAELERVGRLAWETLKTLRL